MRKWLIVLLILGLLISPAVGRAQGGIKLDSMNVELWSEFDQPSMLVINQFVVSQETTLPAEITLRFPKDGNLVAVAVTSAGELFNKEFSGPTEQGDWQAIVLNVDSYDLHRIEYYQPLTRDGNKRQFLYRWFGDYSVEEFTVSVLVPADSTEFTTSPVLQNTTAATNGLGTSGSVTRTDLRMGSPFQFELEYQRTSDALINPEEAEAVQPSEPVSADTPGRISIENFPLIIGGFGLALIGIALFVYWRSTQSSESKPRRRQRHSQSEVEGDVYCHECGARANPGDKFCRTCGSRLRAD